MKGGVLASHFHVTNRLMNRSYIPETLASCDDVSIVLVEADLFVVPEKLSVPPGMEFDPNLSPR